MSISNSATLARVWYPGIDGLRALAVLAVLIYHVWPSWLPGGFAGVDLFFVISGFLITDLLLREHTRTGGINLRAFFARRFRRLAPAACVVLAACSLAALLVGGTVVLGLAGGVLGALTLTSNWVQLIASTDYFARVNTGLFDNFWSLAIEEQFYLLWPVALLALAARPPRLLTRWFVIALGVAVSTTLLLTAAGLYQVAYLSTFGHASGLLAGAVIASLLREGKLATLPRRLWPVLLAAGGFVLLVTVGGRWAATLTLSPVVTLVGTLAAVFLVLGCVLAFVHKSAGPRVLDTGILRWIGRRSYGLYLWHLPLIVLADATVRPLPGWGPIPGRVLAIALAVLLAGLSYRFLELPLLRRVTTARKRRAKRVATMVAVSGMVIALAACGTATNGNTAPPPGAVEDAQGTHDEHAPSGPVLAIGDSVMLASKSKLEEQIPGIQVDAQESRQLTQGARLVTENVANAGSVSAVVIGLGINGVGGKSDLEDAVAAAKGVPVVLVTVSAPVGWQDSVNEAIASVAAENPGNVAVADWHKAAQEHPDLLANDGIHPGGAGGRLYAKTVLDAINTLK